jgi:MoaA/NifB/PqqE/SkfB family radical SAM enzyme
MAANELIGLGLTALRSNFTSLDKPYKLNYAITYRCNSRCRTCGIWKQKPGDELTLQEVQEFAMKNDSFRWIELTGGEPFLRRNIVEIVRAFRENSRGLYLLTIPTNSLCDHDKVIAQLREMAGMRIPKIAVTVSLDGRRELHDTVRGIPGNYEKAIAMFRRISELRKEHPGVFPVFGYTLSRLNQGRFMETYESVRRDLPGITHNDFHINLAQLSDNYYSNAGEDILPDRQVALDDLTYLLGNMRRRSVVSGIEYTFIKKLIEFIRTGSPPMKCRSLDASLFLDSVGNVYPSIMWNSKLANLREIGYDLGRIWRGAEANEVRGLIREGKDPKHWTSCEAYQSIVGNAISLLA